MYKFTLFLTLCVVIACAISFTYGAVSPPARCSDLSYSCSQCINSTFNCRYAWIAPGLYNSEINASCMPTETLKNLLYMNQYTKRVWAYALSNAEIGTTRGQKLLHQNVGTALNYDALAVPCFDKQLCYCRQPPPPPPANITVILWDCRGTINTRVPVSANPTVALIDVNSTRTQASIPASGQTIFFRVLPGAYSISGTAQGWSSATKSIGEIVLNQTLTVDICIDPLPCTVTITVVEEGTRTVLPGAAVVINTPVGVQNATSDAAGTVSFSFVAEAASSATANLVGYQPGSTSGIVCVPGGSNNYTIVLTPLPAGLTVFVRDGRTNDLISGATVSVTSVQNQVTGPAGSVSYLNLNPGTYSASASATGYTSNSSLDSVTLARGQSGNLTVFLWELPCILNVLALNEITLRPISGVFLQLNNQTTTQVTNATGQVTFSIITGTSDRLNNLNLNASLVFVRNDPSSNFVCGRGQIVNITSYYREVVIFYVQAITARTRERIPNAIITYSPARPDGSNAQIYNEAVAVASPPEDVPFVKQFQSPDRSQVLWYLNATALGFESSGIFRYNYTLTNLNSVQLQALSFTAYIIPYEVVSLDPNNPDIAPRTPDTTEGTVVPNDPLLLDPQTARAITLSTIKIGGRVSRDDGGTSTDSTLGQLPPTTPPTPWFQNTTGRSVYGNATAEAENKLPWLPFRLGVYPDQKPAEAYDGPVFASIFSSLSPSSESRFRLRFSLSGYKPNADERRGWSYVSETETLIELKISEFTETPSRVHIFYLPCQLNQFYLLVYLYPFSDPTTRRTTFNVGGPTDSINVQVQVGSTTLTSFVQNFVTKERVAHQFIVTDQQQVRDIRVTALSPPFDTDNSCWLNDAGNIITTKPCAIPSTKLTPGANFPPPSWFSENYLASGAKVPPSNQRIRKVNGANYLSLDYGLIYQAGIGKKRTN